MDGVERLRVSKGEMRSLTVGQAQGFLGSAATEGLKWQACFTIALTTGLRPSEFRDLRWQDVDLDSGRIRVQQTIRRISGTGRVTKAPKTASGRRQVQVDADATALLRKHKAAQNTQRLELGPLWQDYDLCFASEVGTPLENKRVLGVFRRICKRADLPQIRLYDLRHSCASLLLAAGMHPKVVSERLGHSNVSLTLATYSHVLPTLQRHAAETLGRLLRS